MGKRIIAIWKGIKTIAKAVGAFCKQKGVYIPCLVIVGMVIIYLSYLFIWMMPFNEVSLDNLKGEYEKYYEAVNKIRTSHAQIIAGIVGLAIVIVQIIRTITFSKEVKQQRMQIEEERRSNISSQALEQYIKAVEQLKDENIAVRLGGIYSLGELLNAKDKELKNYHNKVIELLCAYVRVRIPFYKEEHKIYEEKEKNKVPVEIDIQAILTVIGRRKNIIEDEIQIDLINTNLLSANFYRATLSRATLSRANLYRADFKGADLSRANLSRVNLSRANLEGANLLGADLLGAYLKGADLSLANLEGAYLEGANLSRAILSRADLSGANLSRAILDGAILSRAILIGADLSGANLSGTDLEGADLKRADLKGADLSVANLSKANFSDANLSGAYFEGIILNNKENNEIEDIDKLIDELAKANNIDGIKLDDAILKRIKETKPELIERIYGKKEEKENENGDSSPVTE